MAYMRGDTASDRAVVTDPEMAAANEYLHSLGGMASVGRFKQVEDLI